MEKPDRDRTEARAAEENSTFLQKYPTTRSCRKRRNTCAKCKNFWQKANFARYYTTVKGDRRASADDLLAVTKRYPLYSKSDRALWMLGDIF